MDYKELAKNLNICGNDGESCKGCSYNGCCDYDCFDKLKLNASTAITELLERAEQAEKQIEEKGKENG